MLSKHHPLRNGRNDIRNSPRSVEPSLVPFPTISLILALDAEYREKAAANKLKKIAPKKLNPEGKAWLPIMSVNREGWHFTLVFSNTERAHDLGKTNDWVVVYFNDGRGEQKCTVVTGQRGVLEGKRIVRGREKECERFYAK